MLTSRAIFPAVASPDGRIFALAGVFRSGAVATNRCEVYQPSTNSWQSIASVGPLWGAAAVSLTSGHILLIGGFSGGPLASVFEYSPETDTWSTAPSMPTRLYNLAATRGVDGRVYVFGGNTISTETTSALVYDPALRRWGTIRSLPRARGNLPAAITAPDGRIHIIGGSIVSPSRETTPVAEVDIYIPSSDSYVDGPTLPPVRPYSGIALGIDGRVYLVGGSVGSAETTSVYSYSLANSTITPVTPLPFPLQYHTLVGTPDGFIVALGGRSTGRTGSDGGPYLNNTLTYSIAGNRWTQ